MQQISLEGTVIKDAYRFTGHSAGIRTLIGWKKFIFTGSDDKTVKIWDVETGSCLRTLYGHTERILAICMWNSYLVSAGVDTTLKIWDIVSGKCVRTIRDINSAVNCLVATDSCLFAGCKDGKIHMWTNRYRYKGCLEGHTDWVNGLLIYNESFLVSCSDDKTIKIWDTKDGSCITTLTGHTEGIRGMCSLQSYLATCGSDFNIFIWDLRTGKRVTVLQGHCDVVSSVVVLDGRYLISADLSSLVVVWDIKEKFKRVYEVTLHSSDVFCLIVFDGRLYSSSRDGSVVRWPKIAEFPRLVAVLNRKLKSTGKLSDNSTFEKETTQRLHDELTKLQAENTRLIEEQLALHKKLQKEYLKSASLKKEMLQRSEEATTLRNEVVALRYETASQKSSMVVTMKDMASSLLISPLTIKENYVLAKSKFSEIINANWKSCEVILKTYSQYTLRYEDRFLLLSLIHRWSLCRHPGIIPVYGCVFLEKTPVSILMEPAPASLRQVMDYCSRKKYKLPLMQRIELAIQITDIVSYLHSLTPPLIHGNLHPDNVLLTTSFTPKLTDVGMYPFEKGLLHRKYDSVFIDGDPSSTDVFTQANDVFSLGRIILYLLREGREINESNATDLSDIEPEGIRILIQRCCNTISSKRPSLDIIKNDLETYRSMVMKEGSKTYVKMKILYDKDNGCYLF